MKNGLKVKNCQKRKSINKILLYCVDNSFETRYITAEFEKQNLLIRFTHICHYMRNGDINFVLKFSPKQTRAFVKLLGENKQDFLYKLKEKFYNSPDCWNIIRFANHNHIKYKETAEPFFYNFGDIYENIPCLYYEDGSLIIPTLYKHPKNGVVKIYLPSGYLYMEISYKNNLKDGLTKCYFQNSKQIDWEQNYTKDKLDGITKSYYKDGKLHREETFVNGVKEGWENFYNEEEGYLEQKQMYAKNVENGPAIEYYPNGQIKHEAYFKNGKQDGITKEYYESGKSEYEGKFKNDNAVGWGIRYYENGNAMWKSPHGRTKGIETRYYENGNVEFTIESIGEKRNGKYIDYFKDGKIRGTGFYKNDKIHGICGNIHYTCEYKNGLRNGFSILYDKKGNIAQKVLYKKGLIVDFNDNNGITGVVV